MAEAAIYARYSSHSQREASIADQVRVCTAEAERRGDRVVKVYREPAKSGTSAIDRPVFQKMISDSGSGAWSRLYVYKQDRFARNRLDSANYKHRLKKNGVALVSATEPISDGPEGILIDGMLESVAEYYSAQLSVVVKRGLEGNALKGMHNGVWLYGYDLGEDGYYHANPEQARVVRMAYQMVDAGSSVPEVVEAMRPYATKRGNRFTAARVTYLLRNEKYKGVYSFGGTRIEGGMEAIVSSELFDRVQGKLGHRRKKNTYDYALSGKLYDGEERRFSGSCGRGKRGKVYHYYRVAETGVSYRREEVEEAVSKAVSEFLSSSPGLREALADAVVRIQDEALSEEHRTADSMRARLAELDRAADNVVDAIAARGASDRLTAKLDGIEEERAYLAAELADVERSAPRISRELMLSVIDAIVACSAPMDVVEKFVARVVIDGREMTITFNVSDPSPGGEGPAREGCSRKYELVGRFEPYTNPRFAFFVGVGTFSISFRWR